jgi:hypothetical protein
MAQFPTGFGAPRLGELQVFFVTSGAPEDWNKYYLNALLAEGGNTKTVDGILDPHRPVIEYLPWLPMISP